MKPTFYLAIWLSLIFFSCKPTIKDQVIKENHIHLLTDTLNVVNITDTLEIAESTCRGCAVENSTYFTVVDSLGIVKLHTVETYDGNSTNVMGGSISKTLVLVPVKPGKTTFTVYRLYNRGGATSDSGGHQQYTIEVKHIK